MTPADLQTPTAQPVPETAHRERLLGLRDARDTKTRTADRLGDQLTALVPAQLRELGRGEQIGALHEPPIGYHVRLGSPAALGFQRVWSETVAFCATQPAGRKRTRKGPRNLSTYAAANVEAAPESARKPETASFVLADLEKRKSHKQKDHVALGGSCCPRAKNAAAPAATAPPAGSASAATQSRIDGPSANLSEHFFRVVLKRICADERLNSAPPIIVPRQLSHCLADALQRSRTNLRCSESHRR